MPLCVSTIIKAVIPSKNSLFWLGDVKGGIFIAIPARLIFVQKFEHTMP